MTSKSKRKILTFANGNEFSNKTIHDYLINSRGTNPLEITRGLPYKKNDDAHVEQKIILMFEVYLDMTEMND